MDPALLDSTPALEPPPGVTPNFENPENITPLIEFTLGICLGVSSLFVILRVWTRFIIMKVHGWDDYTMIIAWLAYIGYVAIGFEAVKYGSGLHQWNVPLSKFIKFLQLANVLEVYYNPLIFITKLSILLQYRRLFFPHKSGKTYFVIHLLIWLNLLFYVAVMIPQILVCIPREKIWLPMTEGYCLDLPAILISGAVVNIISDFSILILPVHKIWQLQLSKRRKWGVSSIFATGLFACVSSVIRLVKNVQFAHTQDITYDLTPIALWTEAEITSGIICGCLPVLPHFFRHFGSKVKDTIVSSRSNKSINQSGEGDLSKVAHNTATRRHWQAEYIDLSGKLHGSVINQANRSRSDLDFP